nr:EPIDERMAL PATTERNING FACTOR-like protein 2 [Ipomoea batatas]GMC54408.1 EPIDERMAL PATTERNING FACTOR-like protein 2 [Ipomoea batatas]GMC55137.1 EPIDERMAL PATTERNING FACTOR-like protein 2 [Ipomoea batatas]
MTCYQQRMLCCRNHHLIIFLLLLSVSSFIHFSSLAQGRDTPNLERTQRRNDGKEVKMRSLIGSRPPRCESICRNCGHCEAVQVPIDDPSESDPKHPQTRTHQFNAVPKVVAYSRGDGIDNYKPMSWKCKCGNHIFNP